MYNNDLKDYLNVLRTREARPPFTEMARLVAAAPTRSQTAIPLYAKFAGALAIGGMIGVGAWVLSAKFHAAAMPRTSSPVKLGYSFLPRESYGSNGSFESYGSLPPKFTHAKSNEPAVIPFTEVEAPALHDNQQSPVLPADNAVSPVIACAIREQVVSLQPIAADTRHISPIATPTSEQESAGSFFSTLGGTISQQFSAEFRQTSFSDAFLGVGYSFSSNSSVRILAGEEVFSTPSSTTTNSISFHDTTFVHDGQSYQNVLGEIQSQNPPSLTRIYWLGASFRYTLGDLSNAIRPFAEAMAGGSTDGFLTHQSLGAEFTVTNNIDLDLLFEASELLPQNSSWLTKAGFSAAMSYQW
jgi:hypothetical protein